MRINLICIGKTDDREIAGLISYYQNRLPKHWNFSITEIPDVKNAKNLSPELIKKEEAKLFSQSLESADYVVLLDEKGKQFTSREFAAKIENWMNASTKRVSFLIGGAYGFADEIYERANEKMSLSKMTFTHQMIRLFFVEQIYRADQILQGKPYHND
ncbi:MAG: 23S rRNA (pseudouridine(1915)-N(3))-methyltransferase RlmH [Chryseobacterium sp. 39-10]|nr:23S rRNA (pseudouridine(1915)-N(3))-methyltransferase RlmH [Chryseobacterium sp.]OJV47738.1 MAG: 23S rRNA (pseudouridine(1915)-N(3))-methyltransferase RlmH [Chryseobacterium sp. 39-10]